MSKTTDAYRRWEQMYQQLNAKIERQKAGLTRLTQACFTLVTLVHDLAVDEEVPLKYRLSCRRVLDDVAAIGVPIPTVDGEDEEVEASSSGNRGE